MKIRKLRLKLQEHIGREKCLFSFRSRSDYWREGKKVIKSPSRRIRAYTGGWR